MELRISHGNYSSSYKRSGKRKYEINFYFFFLPIGQDMQGVMCGYRVKNCGQDFTLRDFSHNNFLINAKDYTQNAIT